MPVRTEDDGIPIGVDETATLQKQKIQTYLQSLLPDCSILL